MCKKTVALLATPLLAVALASCSSTPSPSASINVPATNTSRPPEAARVDEYCAKADQLVADAEKLAANPNDTALSGSIKQRAKDLTTEGGNIAPTVNNYPELSTRISDCEQKIAAASTGDVPSPGSTPSSS